MSDFEMETVEDFRSRLREWLPTGMPRRDDESATGKDGSPEWVARQRELQRKLWDGGFAGIRFPREYGGQGLTAAHQRAFREETVEHELPGQFAVTHGILAATLLDYGTEEQKQRHIPAILRGEELWVQFLSEPSGGSDMAGALTRATRDGDTYIVSGAKTWSTSAHYSDYAMVLCRTDWDAPKHRGLSMLIMPIRSEGVTVKQIELADRTVDFCEEFFDEVVLPTNSIVGEENDGWAVASRLLFHERNMVGGASYNDQPLAAATEHAEDPIVTLARDIGAEYDPVVRQLVGEALVLYQLPKVAADRVTAGMRTGAIPGPGASILKLLSSLQEYRREEIAIEIAGARALASRTPDDPGAAVGTRWLTARTATIAGGTNEMQRNQISERVLGLPREQSADRGLPFREVLANARRG